MLICTSLWGSSTDYMAHAQMHMSWPPPIPLQTLSTPGSSFPAPRKGPPHASHLSAHRQRKHAHEASCHGTGFRLVWAVPVTLRELVQSELSSSLRASYLIMAVRVDRWVAGG